ncbi:Hypothetical predicted protein [Octopus vulgaris]|uniref:Uncharacterized protein n=1 Tax=Octopus vulgaris TaxID=6645 RepID=A0AA36AJW5_OCTVU|nr:Hypothetical predicted protein [Octopus vulgaris]
MLRENLDVVVIVTADIVVTVVDFDVAMLEMGDKNRIVGSNLQTGYPMLHNICHINQVCRLNLKHRHDIVGIEPTTLGLIVQVATKYTRIVVVVIVGGGGGGDNSVVVVVVAATVVVIKQRCQDHSIEGPSQQAQDIQRTCGQAASVHSNSQYSLFSLVLSQ